MRANLEFNLPEDEDLFLTAINSVKIEYVIVNTLEWLRQKDKYQSVDTIEIREIREYIHDELSRYNIDL